LIATWMLRWLSRIAAKRASGFTFLLVARGITQPFYSLD
jgi:hypothetical protein